MSDRPGDPAGRSRFRDSPWSRILLSLASVVLVLVLGEAVYRVGAIAKRHEVLADREPETPITRAALDDPWHPNARGHEAIDDALVPVLRASAEGIRKRSPGSRQPSPPGSSGSGRGR